MQAMRNIHNFLRGSRDAHDAADAVRNSYFRGEPSGKFEGDAADVVRNSFFRGEP